MQFLRYQVDIESKMNTIPEILNYWVIVFRLVRS
jgi:hypothetical protein